MFDRHPYPRNIGRYPAADAQPRRILSSPAVSIGSSRMTPRERALAGRLPGDPLPSGYKASSGKPKKRRAELAPKPKPKPKPLAKARAATPQTPKPKPAKAPPVQAKIVVRGRVEAMLRDAHAAGEELARPEATRKVLLADPALHRRFIREASGKPALPKGKRPGPEWVRQWHKAVDGLVDGGMTRQAATAHLARTDKKLHTRYLAAVNHGKLPDAMWRRQYASVLK